MRVTTSSLPARRNRRLAERRARRRPVVATAALAVGLLAVVGIAQVVPVSAAEASGTTPRFVLASSYVTPAPAPTVAESQDSEASAAAQDALAKAEASVTAAAAVTSDVATSGLDVGVADTTVETDELEAAADRLELGVDNLPEALLPAVTEDVTDLVAAIDAEVSSLRGSLDAAIALKAQQEAEEKARQEAEAAAARAAASTSYPTAAIPSGNGNGDNSPAGAQAYAHSRFSAYGWGDDQFGCLVALWNKESGWNYQAYNRGSGAFGIPQALPGGKMASAGGDWQTNAATQVNWGLGYISGRYGDPCGAWSHSQSTGWY